MGRPGLRPNSPGLETIIMPGHITRAPLSKCNRKFEFRVKLACDWPGRGVGM